MLCALVGTFVLLLFNVLGTCKWVPALTDTNRITLAGTGIWGPEQKHPVMSAGPNSHVCSELSLALKRREPVLLFLGRSARSISAGNSNWRFKGFWTFRICTADLSFTVWFSVWKDLTFLNHVFSLRLNRKCLISEEEVEKLKIVGTVIFNIFFILPYASQLLLKSYLKFCGL